MSEAAYPEALPALTHLHWYVLERVLGQGGFGITYLAKDTNLDQTVAIKEYLPAEFATRLPDSTVRSRTEGLRDRYRWGLTRFIQEARTLARFDHPNIVRVHSVFEFNDTAYIVMRFEEGGTLASMLDRRGTLPEAELLRVLLPVLDGLELVHNAGFIHRDIKPDNIHLGTGGRPVLLDFGSARQAVGSSNTLTILIAPGYAPFEQYYNDPASQGPWTDIYGLGATCYRAICGRAPLDAVSRSKGILGSTQEILVPASVVGAGRYSGRFLAAVDHALAFAEKERPQTIAEWRHELVGESTAPTMTPAALPQHGSFGSPAAAQPTVSAGMAAKSVVAPDAANSVARGDSLRSQSASEPASRTRSTPPWAWIIAVVAIAVAAVGVYVAMSALDREKVANDEHNRAQKQQEEERNAREKMMPLPETPKPAEPSFNAATTPGSPSDRTTQNAPKSFAPHAASQPAKEKAPPAPKSAPLTKIELGKNEPTKTETSPPVAVTTVNNAIPPVAPPLPEPKAPAPRTSREQFDDAEKAWTEQHYADAIKLWKPLADSGNAQAQRRMGDAYSEGRGVDRNATSSRDWYQKAANGGDTGAMIKLGAIFASGKDPTYNLAYIWYGTAADLGSSAAKADRDRVAVWLQDAERRQADKVIATKVDELTKKAKQP